MTLSINLFAFWLLSASWVFADAFDEIKEHHEKFFSLVTRAKLNKNPEQIKEVLEAHLDTLIRQIKSLPKEHPKRLQLYSLGSALGHAQKKKWIILKSRDAQIKTRPPFHEMNLSQGTFNKTLKHVIFLWLTTPQFLDDISQRLDILFDVETPASDLVEGDSLEKKVLLFYPDYTISELRYHPWPVILDAKKIHSLQLMSVSGGRSISSAFGHSALRIVMCDPRRDEISDDCLHDLASHIVLSFRAEVTKSDLLLPLKGVAGSYPSRVFLTPLNDVLEEYLEREGRSIINIPLELSREQIDLFVSQIIRISRQERPYEFFSNNCATEIWALLQSIAVHPKMFSASPLSPNGVVKSLRKAGLINKDFYLGQKRTMNELWQLEEKGLAFLPYEAKLRFFFKWIKAILERNNINFPLSLSELELKNSHERLLLYQDLLHDISPQAFFLGTPRHFQVIIVLLKNFELELKRKLHKALINEASSPQDSPDFLTSEEQNSKIIQAILQWIEANNNQLIIDTQSELENARAMQSEIREKFSENWHLKRQLDLLPNAELNNQENIFQFLDLAQQM